MVSIVEAVLSLIVSLRRMTLESIGKGSLYEICACVTHTSDEQCCGASLESVHD